MALSKCSSSLILLKSSSTVSVITSRYHRLAGELVSVDTVTGKCVLEKPIE